MKRRNRTTQIVVHCSATPPDRDIGAAEIRRWHVEERGWDDIGYHVVIRRDGTVEFGRPLELVGAHCRQVNAESVGICLVGGVDEDLQPEDNFTIAQNQALEIVLDGLCSRYATDDGDYPEVLGHRDIDPHKACPSFDVATWYTRGLDEVVA